MTLTRYVVLFIVGLLFWANAAPSEAQEAPDARSPLEIHLGHMLAGSGQWRTPNEDYNAEDPNGFSHFGADYRLSDDGSHVISEIVGIARENRRAVFWTIYFFYNPVTEEVVSTQVSWNGTYLEGHEPARTEGLQFGETHRSDQIHYNPDGTMSIQRHEIIPVDAITHTTQTYDRDESGSWRPLNFRTWTLLPEG